LLDENFQERKFVGLGRNKVYCTFRFSFLLLASFVVRRWRGGGSPCSPHRQQNRINFNGHTERTADDSVRIVQSHAASVSKERDRSNATVTAGRAVQMQMQVHGASAGI